MGYFITGRLAYALGCGNPPYQLVSNTFLISKAWIQAQYCTNLQGLETIALLGLTTILLGISICLLTKKESKTKKGFISTLRHRLTIISIYGPLTSLRIAMERFSRKKKFEKCFGIIEPFVKGKYGIEIGGPTNMFSTGRELPIYSIAEKIDDCNFSKSTIWDNPDSGYAEIKDASFKKGIEIICDGTDLGGILSESYDFLLSCHSIEHIANTFKALYEWKRILKDEGALILVAPHLKGTYDHKRPLTTLDHMEGDYKNNMDEKDMTHAPETIEKTDIRLTRTDYETFKKRMMDNYNYRLIHHHTFIPESLAMVIDRIGFKILYMDVLATFNIVIIAQKPKPGENPIQIHEANKNILGKDAAWRKNSPFKIDRV